MHQRSIRGQARQYFTGTFGFEERGVHTDHPVIDCRPDIGDHPFTQPGNQVIAKCCKASKDCGGCNKPAEIGDHLTGELVAFSRIIEEETGGRTFHSVFADESLSKDHPETLQWLSELFSPAPLRDNGSVTCADPATCLNTNSTSWEYAAHKNDKNDNWVQIRNTVHAARSFAQNADYYYVQGSHTFGLGSDKRKQWNVGSSYRIQGSHDAVTAFDTSPGSTTCETSLETETSHSLGWDVGFEDGAAGASVSQGSQYGTSSSMSCPDAVIITNRTFGQWPTWLFTHPPKNSYKNTSIATPVSVTWLVPFSEETAHPLKFETQIQSSWIINDNDHSQFLCIVGQILQLPFPTFDPVPPTVTGVMPSSVHGGEIVEIVGEGFYASTVVAVSVGGVALPIKNWDPDGTNTDTSFEFVMPGSGTYPFNVTLPVVVHTQYGVTDGSQSVVLVH